MDRAAQFRANWYRRIAIGRSGGSNARVSGTGAIAVVVVGYNHRAWLEECLGSALKAKPEDRRLDVYFVDNAPADGSGEFVAERFSGVQVIANTKNLGFTGGCNQGLRLALDSDAEYVFLLNPDTVTPPDVIGALAAFMDAYPSYGIVGPLQYRYPDGGDGGYNGWTVNALAQGEEHAFFVDWPDRPSPAGPAEGRAPRTLEHAYVQGSALFTRTELLRRIGLFDERYHSYYEEVDLCRRARWAGSRVALLLDLRICHEGASGGNSRYRRIHLIRNRLYYLFTDPTWDVASALRLAARWLRNDVRGRGVAGPVSAATGAADTATALVRLLALTGSIVSRRRVHRKLLKSGAALPNGAV
jgi:GT2 family glycosyltransferase